jgi:hypothetical protein
MEWTIRTTMSIQMDTLRREYVKLGDELPALMREFGCALSAEELAGVRALVAAVEGVDRVLDAIAERDHRRTFASAVVDLLDGAAGSTGAPEVDARLAELRMALCERDIAAPFVRLARATFATTERMRTTRRARVYLDAVEREGQLLVELALLFVRTSATPAFVEFLRATAELGNLTDKLLDARGDFRRGEIAIRPGLALHARLAARIVRHLPRAAARHPSRLRFAAWGAGWIAALAM